MMTSAQIYKIRDKVASLIFRASLISPGEMGVETGNTEIKAKELQQASVEESNSDGVLSSVFQSSLCISD